jgi:hypothetical protein
MASFALVSKAFYGCVVIGAVVQAFLLYSAVSTIQMIATVQGCPLFVKRK